MVSCNKQDIYLTSFDATHEEADPRVILPVIWVILYYWYCLKRRPTDIIVFLQLFQIRATAHDITCIWSSFWSISIFMLAVCGNGPLNYTPIFLLLLHLRVAGTKMMESCHQSPWQRRSYSTSHQRNPLMWLFYMFIGLSNIEVEVFPRRIGVHSVLSLKTSSWGV